jgi:hypothetical protein
MVDHDRAQRAFLDEVLELVSRLDLRPVAMTGYQREAFVGRGADAGLRVALDRRIRGRDQDHRRQPLPQHIHNRSTAFDFYIALQGSAQSSPRWSAYSTGRSRGGCCRKPRSS